MRRCSRRSVTPSATGPADPDPVPAGDPTLSDIRAAAARIAGRVVRTPTVRAAELEPLVGRRVWLKCENLQQGGSFKLRGATNAVLALPEEVAARGVAAHSSGNHAIALALAAAVRGIPAHVIVPSDAPQVKVERAREAGARIVPCAPTLEAREETLARVLAETGATEIHPYDHPKVIAGAGTAALELIEDLPEPPGCLLVPVGGGGLASGTALALAGSAARPALWLAEPATVDDAARSLAAGRLCGHRGRSVADGLLTTLSERTLRILSRHVQRVVTVAEEAILDAVGEICRRTRLVVEPSGAVTVAALRSVAADLPPGDVAVILSGGNVSPAVISQALAGP